MDQTAWYLIGQLVVLGIVFFFVEKIPMGSPFPELVKAVAAIFAVILILAFFGIHLF